MDDTQKQLAADSGGAALGALIGFAGPFGLVVGAVATPALQRLVRNSLAEFERRGQVLGEAAAVSSGLSVDELTEVVVEDMELQPLLFNVLEAAARSGNQQILRVLGTVLGEAVSARPHAIDEYQLIVAALRDLGPPHVRVLEILERPADPDDPKAGWTAARVIAATTDLTSGGAEAALSGLVRHGLARSTSLWGAIGHELTDFGRAMLLAIGRSRRRE